jgi:glutamate dehydrogenase (NAD(P)+)
MSSVPRRDNRPPKQIFEWKDSKTDASGWIVLDEIINGVSGGGIYMHGNATFEETADIAKNMTRKFTVCDPQIGGAKAGIRFDHRDPRAEGVLKRFICAHVLLLRNVWVTAGDLNTDDSVIEKIIQKELGLPTCQSFLGKAIARATGQPDLSGQLARLIGTPASQHFALIEGAVGYGVAAAIESVLPSPNSLDFTPFRVAIQGFGAVGSSLAHFLITKKIAIVVSICDVDGFICHPNGLDIEELLQIRNQVVQNLIAKKAPEDLITKHKKNIICNLDAKFESWCKNPETRFIRRDPVLSAEEFFLQFLKSQPAEVIVPAASRYVLTEKVVHFLLNEPDSPWHELSNRFIVSGANNPFGIVDAFGNTIDDRHCTLQTKLSNAGVCVVPDWVANSGTAQLFHRGLSVSFDFDSKNLAETVLEACAIPIRKFIVEASRRSFNFNDSDSESSSYATLRQLPLQCDLLALERIRDPMPFVTPMKVNRAGSRYAYPPIDNLCQPKNDFN